MPGDTKIVDSHYSLNELDAYLSGQMPDQEATRLEVHLGLCPECMDQAGRLAEAFDLVEKWTLEEHHAVYQQSLLEKALEQVTQAASGGPLRERLREWKHNWSAVAEGALRVILQAPGQLSKVMAEGLEALARSDSDWQLARAHSGPRVRGAVRTRGAIRAPVRKVEVTITGRHGIEIRVDRLAHEKERLVLLVPTLEGVEPQVTEFRQSDPRSSQYTARFEDLSPGEYLILFEPDPKLQAKPRL